MTKELIHYGRISLQWNAARTRILKFSCELSHNGLNEHKKVSAPKKYLLENKIEKQVAIWEEKWKVIQVKNMILKEKEKNLSFAKKSTKIANDLFYELDTLLLHALSVNNIIDWESLKDKKKFEESYPTKPIKDPHKIIPEKPNLDSDRFKAKYSFLEKIFKFLKNKKDELTKALYEEALKHWKIEVTQIMNDNIEIDKKYDDEIANWNILVATWEKRKKDHLLKQQIYNDNIEKFKEKYFQLDEYALIKYCNLVLNNSEYPDFMPKSYELEYNYENKILIVEYSLPDIEKFPRLKEMKYIATRKELKEYNISDKQLSVIYDNVIYQIALRTLHELFEADVTNVLNAISFNGWVDSINKATGKSQNKCILSLQAKKEEFLEIELANVNPKACFKNLKGVACSKLSTLTAIKPIINITKTDRRFVEGYAVVDSIDNATNIAAMDWKDFEHLIRELFEKEFSTSGGEVKVTRASRDGGVDAIAFDPDPIRGGKVAIQAKRYINIVGVSAVRDLYGTILNEGATKGILVTTASYGADAYEFAKNKPITLLDGSNLLFLLQKHGHNAKIDLAEARKFLKEEI